jgi:hypothetical protein
METSLAVEPMNMRRAIPISTWWNCCFTCWTASASSCCSRCWGGAVRSLYLLSHYADLRGDVEAVRAQFERLGAEPVRSAGRHLFGERLHRSVQNLGSARDGHQRPGAELQLFPFAEHADHRKPERDAHPLYHHPVASAEEAAAIANEYANVAIKYIASTMSTEEPNIMSVALVPTNPAYPSKTRNIILGFVIGFLVAVGWLTTRFVMDDKIKSVDDIRKYSSLPILAVVPVLESVAAEKKQIGKARKKP